MKKIPTLFKRDPENMKHVLPEVTPNCEWVLAGEGIATRKYDGTCVMRSADEDRWWARREVKPSKASPPEFLAIERDLVTGKTVGWEPIEQSPFAKFHAEALCNTEADPVAGTYELIGPKINGNPESYEYHTLIRHTDAAVLNIRADDLSYERLARIMAMAGPHFEGIVWHHPDGRMAKLKVRDFPLRKDDLEQALREVPDA